MSTGNSRQKSSAWGVLMSLSSFTLPALASLFFTSITFASRGDLTDDQPPKSASAVNLGQESSFIEKAPGVFEITAKDNKGITKIQEVLVKSLGEGKNQVKIGFMNMQVRDGMMLNPGKTTMANKVIEDPKTGRSINVTLITEADMPGIIVRGGKIELISIEEQNKRKIDNALAEK